jgi:hypothetical protein
MQEKLPPLEIFDARLVQVPLRGLFTNMDRDLERRLRGAQESSDREAERRLSLLMIMLRVTINSYEAVCFLISNTDENPKRKDHFALVVPPANRQLLDLLFTLEQYLPITPEQKAAPLVIPYWRSPFRLKRNATKSQPFLEYLDKWLYGETSAQAHLNAAGLSRVGLFVLSSLAPEEMREIVEGRTIYQYTSRHFLRTLITALAIASEIDAFCQLNNREALARLRGLLAGYVEEARDVYEQRYQAMLT